MKQTERDLAFQNESHKWGSRMGMSDAEIFKFAKTNGDIDPVAMRLYLGQYEKGASD